MEPQQIPYANTGRFRPCFKVVFYNPITLTSSVDTFGLVDSGADDIIIPYSIGLKIGLQGPTATEIANPRHTSGIGGDTHYLPRDGQIKFIETHTNNVYVFKEIMGSGTIKQKKVW